MEARYRLAQALLDMDWLTSAVAAATFLASRPNSGYCVADDFFQVLQKPLKRGEAMRRSFVKCARRRAARRWLSFHTAVTRARHQMNESAIIPGVRPGGGQPGLSGRRHRSPRWRTVVRWGRWSVIGCLLASLGAGIARADDTSVATGEWSDYIAPPGGAGLTRRPARLLSCRTASARRARQSPGL
jgi:hypothetical protein